MNGAIDKSNAEALRRSVFNPFGSQTPGILKRFGIEYAVIFNDPEMIALQKVHKVLPEGFKLIKKYSSPNVVDAYLFRVDAKPAKFVPVLTGNITVPVITTKGVYSIIAERGSVEILSYSKKTIQVDVSMLLKNPFRRKIVKVLKNGKVLWIREYRTRPEGSYIFK